MTSREPDFDQLVGPEVEATERERLRRVHEALVAAGPPPELSPAFAAPLPPDVVRIAPRRRRVALLAVAAALGVLAFALGFLVGDGGGPYTDRVIAMSGSSGASASLEMFKVDDAGNWPMELSVEGLQPSPAGRVYQLWLTQDGALAALCGNFRAEPDGTTVVPMNAPWRLSDFDGWVVVEEDSTTPLLTT